MQSGEHAQRKRNSNGSLITAQVKLARENTSVTGNACLCFNIKAQFIVREYVGDQKMGDTNCNKLTAVCMHRALAVLNRSALHIMYAYVRGGYMG